MAPSIRVNQDVYRALKTLIDAGYAKNLNAVVDKLLREAGEMPSESSDVENLVFERNHDTQFHKKSYSLSTSTLSTTSSMSETDVKAFARIFGKKIPNYRFQRDAMRELHRLFNGDKKMIVKAYAWLEEEGHTLRKKNSHNFDPRYYAEALYNDGINKGWLTEKK